MFSVTRVFYTFERRTKILRKGRVDMKWSRWTYPSLPYVRVAPLEHVSAGGGALALALALALAPCGRGHLQ